MKWKESRAPGKCELRARKQQSKSPPIVNFSPQSDDMWIFPLELLSSFYAWVKEFSDFIKPLYCPTSGIVLGLISAKMSKVYLMGMHITVFYAD